MYMYIAIQLPQQVKEERGVDPKDRQVCRGDRGGGAVSENPWVLQNWLGPRQGWQQPTLHTATTLQVRVYDIWYMATTLQVQL